MSTSGRNSPVETSPSREAPPTACDVICRLPKLSISATSGQNCCRAAITEKSTDCASVMAAKTVCSQPLLRPILGDGGEGGRLRGRLWLCFGWRGRLRASLTTFSCPGVCLMSEVNSAMKDNCHCWQADQGGMVQNRAGTRGLWSKKTKVQPLQQRPKVSDRAESC